MADLSFDELSFFHGKQDAISLYTFFRDALLRNIDAVEIQVKKTQISFKNRHLFGAVSFAPIRKAKARPDPYITVTFGLARKIESPRIDAAVEAYPNRWTHHITVGDIDEIDNELIQWVKEAADFSNVKR